MTCPVCLQPLNISGRGRPHTGRLCWRCRRVARRYLDLHLADVHRLLAAARHRGKGLLAARIAATLSGLYDAELDSTGS